LNPNEYQPETSEQAMAAFRQATDQATRISKFEEGIRSMNQTNTVFFVHPLSGEMHVLLKAMCDYYTKHGWDEMRRRAEQQRRDMLQVCHCEPAFFRSVRVWFRTRRRRGEKGWET